MDKLKLRLEPLKLSEERKEKIMGLMGQAAKPKKQFVFIPYIMPVFVAIALLLLVVNVMPGGELTRTSGKELFTQQSFPIRYYVLMTISSLEVIAVYILLRLTLAQTKRWKDKAWLQELYAQCMKLPLVITVLLVIIGMMWRGLFYFANRPYVEIIFIVSTYFCLMLILQYKFRHMARTTCPHCGVKMTRSQIIVKSAMQYRERCNSCKELIYLTKESKQQLFPLFFWTVMPIWIGNFASLYESYAITFCIVNVTTLIIFYIPIMTEFTKENTDPEKMIE